MAGLAVAVAGAVVGAVRRQRKADLAREDMIGKYVYARLDIELMMMYMSVCYERNQPSRSWTDTETGNEDIPVTSSRMMSGRRKERPENGIAGPPTCCPHVEYPHFRPWFLVQSHPVPAIKYALGQWEDGAGGLSDRVSTKSLPVPGLFLVPGRGSREGGIHRRNFCVFRVSTRISVEMRISSVPSYCSYRPSDI